MDGRKEINIEVGANIKREREKAGLTQEQFSEMIGLGSKSLSAVERGTVGISLAALRRICNALSISSDAILFPNAPENDISNLSKRLQRLTPEQYELADAIMNKLLEAFALADKKSDTYKRDEK